MDAPILFENGSLRLRRCRHGAMMYFANDMYVGRSLDLYGEFSEGEAALLQQIVRPGMVVVEAGANLGAHTVHMAKSVGAAGLVLAFEPQRIVHQLLCGNLALNGIANVRPRRAALGSAEGDAIVPDIDYAAVGNFGSLALGEWQRGEQVQVLTLDSLALEHCDFIKIDVEGMEHAVLEGARSTIARHRPILYVENDRPDRSSRLLGWLLAQGYRLYWHIPLLFNERNFFGNPEDVFPMAGSINILGVPAELEIKVANLRPVESAEEDWRSFVCTVVPAR